MISIRAALDRDADKLPDIERSSGAIFREWPGLEWIADDGVQSLDQHLDLISHGIALVADEQGFGIAGFLNGEVAPDALHLHQIAVHRDRQGRGIGRQLIEAAQQIGAQRGVNALTLTTFRDVPWNEPYYQRLGFRTLQNENLNQRLRTILETERLAGLPLEKRCAMIKTL
jgi:GNAT superfamily N-acetyltransferase